MADVNANEAIKAPKVAEAMAEKLQNLVNGSSELPWNQDYAGKENGVNLPLPVLGRNGTPLRGIPALYLSTVLELRGIDDPRFYTFDMLKSMSEQLAAENEKLPAKEQKHYLYGVKKGAKSYEVQLAAIGDKHIGKDGAAVPISSAEKNVHTFYVNLFSAADIVKRELAPSKEKEGRYTVLSETPLEASNKPVRKTHLSLEEYKAHNVALAEWLSQTGDVERFYSAAFDIVKAQKERREAKRQAKFERTNPQNYKYFLPKPFEDMDFSSDEMKELLSRDIIVHRDEPENGGFGAIYTKEKIPYDIANNLNLKRDEFQASRNTLVVEVYRVSDNAEANFKESPALAAVENTAFNFNATFEPVYSGSFNRELFNFNKLYAKIELQPCDIVRMNDKMFYVDDNKTFKSIAIKKVSVPLALASEQTVPVELDSIVPVESKELSSFVENFKNEIGEANYSKYCDRFQKILVEGRGGNDYNHYAKFINEQALCFGLNKSVHNQDGWEAADMLYTCLEYAQNPQKTISDIQTEIHFNSPGAVISDNKNYARDVVENAFSKYPAIKEAIEKRTRETAIERTAEPEMEFAR